MSHVVGIVGPPACGKSSYLGRLLEAHRHPRRRFLVSYPFKGVRGVDVGSVAELRCRTTWPPVARIDDDGERVVELALEVRDCTAVIDEAETWAPKSYADVPESAMSRICRRGRHHRTALIWASQSPWDVHVTLRSRTGVWVLFPFTHDVHAVAWVASTCGQAVADAVSRHTGYRPLIWTAEQGLRLSE